MGSARVSRVGDDVSPSRTSIACIGIADCFGFRYSLTVSVKEQVLQAINRLPDDIDYRDVADEITFLAAVREAERDIEQGRVVTNEQMKARISEWTAS